METEPGSAGGGRPAAGLLPEVADSILSAALCKAALLGACVILLLLLTPSLLLAEPEDGLLPGGQAGEADGGQGDGRDILDMDIDQLGKVDVLVPSMDVEVTSVAKQESTVGRSPAAISVITSEMIRRSGANSIPDLLRTVPGLEVARISANSWAIASRGFNSYFTNKLLVLIDGRSVYDPVFSGVNWDSQDVLLEDIERIEVIRGPGGTLWGANAVNGVINIITKRAQDTQGMLLTAGGGSEDRAVDGIRYGGRIGERMYWRIYGKHFERDAGFDAAGLASDDWRMGRGGFRVDWELDPCQCNTLTVQGDYYSGYAGRWQSAPIPDPPFTGGQASDLTLRGENVLARWTHSYDEDSDWSLQTYFDRYVRRGALLEDYVNTFDVDFQHRFPLGYRHHVIWGIGYRQVADRIIGDGFVVGISPTERASGVFSGFVQDEITLVEDRLYFTVGSKFEHNDYTDFEYQPGARLLWTPDRRHSAWASISRAVRTAARFEQDGTFTLPHQTVPFPLFPRITGTPDFGSEELVAYEIGYRAQATEQLAWDLATFINVYDDVQSARPGTPYFEGTNLIVPLVLGNSIWGQTYGVEVAGHWKMSEVSRLSASYSFLQIQLHSTGTGSGFNEEGRFEGSSPHNQVRFWASWDLPRCWELDLALRYVDNLPVLDVGSYITMDVRLAWAPSENLEVAVVGQNLLDQQHREFRNDVGGPFIRDTEVERGVFSKVTWKY